MQGHLEKRGKTWTIVLEDERVDNKRNRIYKATGYTRKSDAGAEMKRMIREYDSGLSFDVDNLTVAAYLKEWLEAYGKPKLAQRTYTSYTQMINRHVTPYIGQVPLTDLKPLHLQKLYKQLVSNGARGDKKPGGLSHSSLVYTHRILHKALDTAVKWQMVIRNVADAVELPSRPVGQESLSVLNEAQVGAMLSAAEPTPHHPALYIAVWTGMRRGEIYGLRWQDIDLVNKRINVKQTIQYDVSKGIYFKEPKTKSGRRSIAITQSDVDMLHKHSLTQGKHRMRLGGLEKDGGLYKDSGLVFCGEDGSPTHPDTISKWFPRFMVENDLPRLRFHDLRHTHVTLLIKAGVDIKTVSERVGHASAMMTLDRYAHVLPDQQEAAASKLDKLIRKT